MAATKLAEGEELGSNLLRVSRPGGHITGRNLRLALQVICSGCNQKLDAIRIPNRSVYRRISIHSRRLAVPESEIS
jgi:hypothetical protein